MFTLALLTVLIILFGFVFKKKLCQRISPNTSDDSTYMGAYVGTSICVVLASILALMIISMAAPMREIDSAKYDMVQINNAYLVSSNDKYGRISYAYSYVVNNEILTGYTTSFNMIAEDSTPFVTITKFESKMGAWGFGLRECDEYKIVPSISLKHLNNINHTQVVLEK